MLNRNQAKQSKVKKCKQSNKHNKLQFQNYNNNNNNNIEDNNYGDLCRGHGTLEPFLGGRQ